MQYCIFNCIKFETYFPDKNVPHCEKWAFSGSWSQGRREWKLAPRVQEFGLWTVWWNRSTCGKTGQSIEVRSCFWENVMKTVDKLKNDTGKLHKKKVGTSLIEGHFMSSSFEPVEAIWTAQEKPWKPTLFRESTLQNILLMLCLISWDITCWAVKYKISQKKVNLKS